MFTVDTRAILGDETLLIEGELSEDIFELGPDDLIQPVGPLTYKAEASVITGNLLVRGRFSQTFKLACVRCLQPFDFEVDLNEISMLEPLENLAVIDLTEALREDILLALPSFPHCDEAYPDGTPAARECPATGNFEAERAYEPLDPETDERPVADGWKASTS